MLSRTYRKWDSMKGRCYRESHPAFKYYGAKGVTVCERWRDSYRAFLQDMGEAPEGMWIDRIDRGKGYEPGNVRWVTPKESAANRGPSGAKRNPNSIRQRAIAAGLPYHMVYQRVKWGWTMERALSTPKMVRSHMERAGLR